MNCNGACEVRGGACSGGVVKSTSIQGTVYMHVLYIPFLLQVVVEPIHQYQLIALGYILCSDHDWKRESNGTTSWLLCLYIYGQSGLPALQESWRGPARGCLDEFGASWRFWGWKMDWNWNWHLTVFTSLHQPHYNIILCQFRESLLALSQAKPLWLTSWLCSWEISSTQHCPVSARGQRRRCHTKHAIDTHLRRAHSSSHAGRQSRGGVSLLHGRTAQSHSQRFAWMGRSCGVVAQWSSW